jgi:hypothetical protein
VSRGPGAIEKRIADLLALTRDRALSIEEITDHAFALRRARPTRAQRLSATRATHRLLRRVREADERDGKLRGQARAKVEAELGRPQPTDVYDKEFHAKLEAEPAWLAAEELHKFCWHIGVWLRIVRVEGKPGRLRGERDHWCATTVKGRLLFHPPDAPVQVWAVSLGPGGITWVEAEVTKITERNVMVRYGGEAARLDRERLWRWWALWRGVMFVSSRTGRIAAEIDQLWHRRYGARGSAPPSMQMPLATAIALLGVKHDYTKADVLAAFRRKAKAAHPDAGGTAEMFRALVEARDRLLAALGTSAPPPKPPSYAPKGAHLVYRQIRQSQSRLGTRRSIGYGQS